MTSRLTIGLVAAFVTVLALAFGLAETAAAGGGNDTLSVTVSGPGTVAGNDDVGGTTDPVIDCGVDCLQTYTPSFVCSTFNVGCGTVALTANPGLLAVFDHWEGACSGTTPTCDVYMSDDRSVTAVFSGFLLPPLFILRYLTVTKAGTGGGTVTSSPGGIDCGTTCSYGFVEGTVVTITPTAAAGSVFSGWSGACAGTPANSPCVLTLTSDLGATATFTAVPSYAVTVTKAGTGAGSVGSSPPGVSCGSTCSASFLSGTGVTLTAVPDSGSAFGGWSGACSGTGTTCNLAVDAAKAVTATFASSGGAAPPSGDCTITGTSGNDTLTGTNGDDVICGLAGNDTIRALGGDDEVDGGPGNDTIYGGAGKDDLRGGRGADRLLGGPAKDVLVGGRGVDRAVGGKGTDRCSAEVKVTCP